MEGINFIKTRFLYVSRTPASRTRSVKPIRELSVLNLLLAIGFLLERQEEKDDLYRTADRPSMLLDSPYGATPDFRYFAYLSYFAFLPAAIVSIANTGSTYPPVSRIAVGKTVK